MSYFIYILECSNGTYYTGYTTDIERRYQEHVSGSSKCKYTRSFPPKRIAACWEIISEDSSLARKIESEIKSTNRQEKLKLIQNSNQLESFLIEQDYDLAANCIVPQKLKIKK